jgi:hypothetical protein
MNMKFWCRRNLLKADTCETVRIKMDLSKIGCEADRND